MKLNNKITPPLVASADVFLLSMVFAQGQVEELTTVGIQDHPISEGATELALDIKPPSVHQCN